jgi:hypothetical protein
MLIFCDCLFFQGNWGINLNEGGDFSLVAGLKFGRHLFLIVILPESGI